MLVPLDSKGAIPMWGFWRREQHDNKGGRVVVPDEIHTEPLTGYRYWRVLNDGKGLALYSMHAHYQWTGTTNTATCHGAKITPQSSVEHADKSPHPDCACGLYTQNPKFPLQEWQNMTRGVVSASGSVQMFGRVIVCKLGYKAEHATIDSPVVIEAACLLNCRNRPTRIQLPLPESKYYAWCDTHRPNYVEHVATVEADVWLRYAVAELSERYPTVEFISSAQLGA